MRSAACDFAGNGKLSHDTTMERIGWRVIPAAYLGGGGRGGVARTVVWRHILIRAALVALLLVERDPSRVYLGVPGLTWAAKPRILDLK
jgi:hypothetical protein